MRSQYQTRIDNTKYHRLIYRIEVFSRLRVRMYGIFHSLRKRAVKRRFVALWFCLVAIELFCPALCEQTFAETSNFSQAELNISTKTKSGTSETSLSSCDDQGEHGQSVVCNDECLCHAIAIPSVAIRMDPLSVQRERIAVRFHETAFNSLPPPYLPPKVS